MLGYNIVEEFVNNIFYSRGKNVGNALGIWIREIISTNANLVALYDAEKEIMNDETIKLEIPVIKKLIQNKQEPQKVIPYRHYCEWCKGTGIIGITAKFDEDGKYIPTQDYALRCSCKNGTNKTIVQAQVSNRNCETKIKGGYLLAWKNVMDRASYLKRCRENEGYDFMKVRKVKGA